MTELSELDRLILVLVARLDQIPDEVLEQLINTLRWEQTWRDRRRR